MATKLKVHLRNSYGRAACETQSAFKVARLPMDVTCAACMKIIRGLEPRSVVGAAMVSVGRIKAGKATRG